MEKDVALIKADVDLLAFINQLEEYRKTDRLMTLYEEHQLKARKQL